MRTGKGDSGDSNDEMGVGLCGVPVGTLRGVPDSILIR
jgi:hypothetical protein